MPILRTLQTQIRRNFGNARIADTGDTVRQSERLLSPREFRNAAVCERMRIYRNNSVLVVLLIDVVSSSEGDDKQQTYSVIEECLVENLAPIDTLGLTEDGRVGVLIPDYTFDDAQEISDRVAHECWECGCGVSIEIIQFPDDSIDGLIGAHQDGNAKSLGLQQTSAASFFSVKIPAWKRGLDIAGASIGLTIAMPFILIGVLLVKLSSSGTGLFYQQRTGQAGRPFTIKKIRTMRMGAENLVEDIRHLSDRDGPAFKLKNDPRTLFVGRLLRKLSIDELPQLWNVLIGDMSLVGPRPLPISEANELKLWQQERHDVKPGITGPWQISGRDNVAFDEWMRMDVEYARNLSIAEDIKILLLTVPAVLLCRGSS